jgi:apolipoprotein N-acyltransferase
MKPLILSFLAGMIAALGFEPLGLWPLTLAAVAGLIWLVERAPSLRSALARGWWFGLGNFVRGLNWIATAFTYQAAMPHWLGWIAVVLLSLYLAIFPAAAAGLAWRYGRSDQLTLALLFAAAWIVTEWLRATLFTGFAWNPLGVALVPTWIAGTATLVGTYGLSAVAVLLSGALLLLIGKEWWRALMLAAPALIVSGLVWTLSSTSPARDVSVRIVQPNIGQEEKWESRFEDGNFQRLARLSVPVAEGPRLLLWPEAAVTEPLEDGRRDRFRQLDTFFTQQRVRDLLAPGDLLLTGGVTIQSADGDRATSGTNSVFAMTREEGIIARYDKAHLVPYGEYLPMRSLLSSIGLSRLAPGDIDFDSGPGPRSLNLPVIGKAGLQICYEIIFSGKVVDRNDRPGFIFNPSNDAWFGAWGPPQHLAQARLRAIEEGLPVLRSTPTGVSAVIDAEGRLLAAIPWRQEGAIDAPIPGPKEPTLFARLGNAAPLILALALAALGLLLPPASASRSAEGRALPEKH